MLRFVVLLVCVLCFSSTWSSIIDVIEQTNGHEPRVAIRCGLVPFYVDIETGAWVADSADAAVCDHDKEEVKRYCQKIYPTLNITNVVEANKPIKFNNWCEPGSERCDQSKKVIPYRCLVNEYEADALMVPDGCNFDHIHEPKTCLNHHAWKVRARKACRANGMKLRDYGILLSCDTDMFTGVEFVCCPWQENKESEPPVVVNEQMPATGVNVEINREALAFAVRMFKKHLPIETQGCDRSSYLVKRTAMEDRHRNQIAAVVDEWDDVERRYNKLKERDAVAAEEKMKRTLEVFKETLKALEDESKSEKNRLRAEHADCINTQIEKDKRDAMLNYLTAVEEVPPNAEHILNTVRAFIQVCEHDRVHSLRHFEHVRNRDEQKAESLRGELLEHLKDLNKVVNESMSLLNYLPDIAQEFGLSGGAVLKPRTKMPDEEKHVHGRVEQILKKTKNYYTDNAVSPGTATQETTFVPKDPKPEEISTPFPINQDDDIDDERESREKGHRHRGKRSVALTAVLGLSCGVVVVMMFVVIAMVMRRQRLGTRVVVTENNNDREHLVQMQKSGFENPTYKFFYY